MYGYITQRFSSVINVQIFHLKYSVCNERKNTGKKLSLDTQILILIVRHLST